MFTHHCTACERDQLIFPSMISGVSPLERGLHLTFTCWCGQVQTRDIASFANPQVELTH